MLSIFNAPFLCVLRNTAEALDYLKKLVWNSLRPYFGKYLQELDHSSLNKDLALY